MPTPGPLQRIASLLLLTALMGIPGGCMVTGKILELPSQDMTRWPIRPPAAEAVEELPYGNTIRDRAGQHWFVHDDEVWRYADEEFSQTDAFDGEWKEGEWELVGFVTAEDLWVVLRMRDERGARFARLLRYPLSGDLDDPVSEVLVESPSELMPVPAGRYLDFGNRLVVRSSGRVIERPTGQLDPYRDQVLDGIATRTAEESGQRLHRLRYRIQPLGGRPYEKTLVLPERALTNDERISLKLIVDRDRIYLKESYELPWSWLLPGELYEPGELLIEERDDVVMWEYEPYEKLEFQGRITGLGPERSRLPFDEAPLPTTTAVANGILRGVMWLPAEVLLVGTLPLWAPLAEAAAASALAIPGGAL